MMQMPEQLAPVRLAPVDADRPSRGVFQPPLAPRVTDLAGLLAVGTHFRDRIAVIAGIRVVGERASFFRIAPIGGAGIVVVAEGGWTSRTLSLYTGIPGGTGIASLTRLVADGIIDAAQFRRARVRRALIVIITVHRN